jgi:hypothetical protein
METQEVPMGVFGPWLPWLFAVGAVLLVGGLVAKEVVGGPAAARFRKSYRASCHSKRSSRVPPPAMARKPSSGSLVFWDRLRSNPLVYPSRVGK